MASSLFEYKVAQLFKTIIDGEKQLEAYRQVLVEQPGFDPYLTFNLFDQSSQGNLSPLSLSLFLKEHGIDVIDEDIINFFNSYDARAPELSYSSFLNIIFPRASPSLRHLSSFNEASDFHRKKDKSVTYEVKWALVRVLDKQINFTKRIEALKKDLLKQGDFALPQVFDSIDTFNTGSLNIDSIYIFLKKNKVVVSENDVVILLRSIDHNTDGKLSYSEFLDLVLPALSPYRQSIPKPKSTISKKSKSPQKHVSFNKKRSKSLVDKTLTAYLSENSKRKSIGFYKDTFFSKERRYSADKLKPYYSVNHARTQSMMSDNTSFNNTFNERSFNDSSFLFNHHGFTTLNVSTGKKDLDMYRTPNKHKKEASHPRSRPYTTSIKDSYSRKASVNYLKYEEPNRGVSEDEEMTEKEEKDLASVLRQQINIDREMQNTKNELILQADFNLVDTFRLFDVENNGFIDKYELEEGFKIFHIFPSKKELYLLMKRYDRDQDGLLKYVDFCNMIAPRQDGYGEEVFHKAVSSMSKRIPKMLSMNTTLLLRKTLETIISNEAYSEALRQKLNSKPGFSIYKAFKALDKQGNGFITIEDLKDILNTHGFCASQKELLWLLRRFDKNQDGRISYNEFVEEIRPKITGRR